MHLFKEGKERRMFNLVFLSVIVISFCHSVTFVVPFVSLWGSLEKGEGRM